MLLCATAASLPLTSAQGMQTSTAFVIASAQFHQRDPEDAGEVRLCIQNTGEQTLSTAQVTVRVLAERTASSKTPDTTCECVYTKLSPPLLQPGQYGEIVAKFRDRPAQDCRLTCDMSGGSGTISHVVCLSEPALWISYVGFSEDVRKIFVYLENLGREPVDAQLLRVGQFDVSGRANVIHSPIPRGDKGCLTADLPFPLTDREFVHVVIGQSVNGPEPKVQTVVRAIHTMPVTPEFGGGAPDLGLDVQRPFCETMACPAHAHGTPKEAAAKFLRDYTQRFSVDPRCAIQMAICRSDMPKAWFRFGPLPDVAAVNTCLCPPPHQAENPQKWFCPFAAVGDLAKRATEPGRFLAIIPTGPEVREGSLLLKGLTSQEWRFLVYCAIASGAKGISYRGLPASDPLSRNDFRQLNCELQHLKPLLLIAEPVEWAATIGNGYAARSLLCGNHAIVIVVFDGRYFSQQRNGRFYTPAFKRAVASARVNVRIPTGVAVKAVETPYASLDPNSWECRNGTLDLTAEMTDSTQVYIAWLKARTGPSEEGLLQ